MRLVVAKCFLQLSQGIGQFGIVGRNTVPFVGSFHEVDPFAHGGGHQYHDGLALTGEGFGLSQGIDHILHRIAVHFKHFPAERFPLGAEVAEAHDPVSYTHPTLPTILRVWISVCPLPRQSTVPNS